MTTTALLGYLGAAALDVYHYRLSEVPGRPKKEPQKRVSLAEVLAETSLEVSTKIRVFEIPAMLTGLKDVPWRDSEGA